MPDSGYLSMDPMAGTGPLPAAPASKPSGYLSTDPNAGLEGKEAAPQPAWRTNHPWLAAGVDAVKAGLNLQSMPTGGPSLPGRMLKSVGEQIPELAGAGAGMAAAGPLAATAAGAFPPAAPFTVPAIEAAGAFSGAYLGRGAKYGAEKLGQAAGVPGIPAPPSSMQDAYSGMRTAGAEAGGSSLFFGALGQVGKLTGAGKLAQQWAKALTDSIGDVAPNVEQGGKRMVGGIVQQELEKKAPLNAAYNDVLSAADQAEMQHPIIGRETSEGLDQSTTRQLHQRQAEMLTVARNTKPGPEQFALFDTAAQMKQEIVRRLNGYQQDAGDAYQHISGLWHSMADTQLNPFIQQLKKDPSNAIDVFFRKSYPVVKQTVQGAGATAGVVARKGMDKDAIAMLAPNAMPEAAWNDTKANILDRALGVASRGGTLLGKPLQSAFNLMGPDTMDAVFGPTTGQQLRDVVDQLIETQRSSKFELAERFGTLEGIREAVQGKMGRALEAISLPVIAKKMTGIPAAWGLYNTLVKSMPTLAVSSNGQRFLSLLLQAAQPGESSGMIPPPPTSQAQTVPPPPR